MFRILGIGGFPIARPLDRVWLVVAFAALLAVSGCGSVSAPSGATGSTMGTVIGQLANPQVRALVFVAGDGTSNTVEPAADGRFSITLPAGSWRVMAATGGGQLSLIEQAIVVEAGVTATLVNIKLVPKPVVTSVTVTALNPTSAVITWETDIDADGRVDYGFDTHYPLTVNADDRLTREHRVQLTTLQPGTVYHFRVVSSRHRLESTETFSSDRTFTTPTN